jgi:DNA-binding CsgD family transcriptional regulator
MERDGIASGIDSIIRDQPEGMRAIGSNSVCHWRKLDDAFAPAPGGILCTIEPRSPGYITADIGDVLSRFQRKHDLTPRERDIMDLVLQGCPNSRIATKLAIAIGTVRNHRYRLYNKLDITTERELFFTFIDFLLGGSRSESDRKLSTVATDVPPVAAPALLELPSISAGERRARGPL